MLDNLTTLSERQGNVTALSCAIKTARKKGVEMAQIQIAEKKLAAGTKTQQAHDIAVKLTPCFMICACEAVAHPHAQAQLV